MTTLIPKYDQGAIGAVNRSINFKLAEQVSVKDFGAIGDGTTDDTAAIQAGVNYLATTNGGTLLFPKGTYAISSSINILGDAITLQGEGTSISDSGVSLNGATVIKTTANINAVYVNSIINNLSIKNIYINSAVTSGSALAIGPSGNANNLLLSQIYVQGMANALNVSATSIITHAQIEFCQFGYTTNEHVIFADGAIINSILFLSTRFEPAGDGYSLLKATGNAQATGSCKFINCIFESAKAVKAVDCGANVITWSFIGCHFENNASPISGVATDNGCDIYIGGGQANVNISGCSFSFPYSTATNFYNIISNSGAKVLVSNNSVVGQGRAGYLGFIYNSNTTSVTLIGNYYNESGLPAIDYMAGIVNPIKVNDYQGSYKWGAVNSGIVKSITTTNATPTQIWGALYQLQASEAVYATADVVGTDITGAVYCAFTVRELITTNESNNGTSKGSSNNTKIASSTQAVTWSILGTSGTLGFALNVTGIAATTIKWMANITFNKIAF